MLGNYARPIKEVPHSYNLRNRFICGSHKIKTVRYDKENITYLDPKILLIVPNEIKELASMEIFREKIKLWKPDSCSGPICKKYIGNIGPVNPF